MEPLTRRGLAAAAIAAVISFAFVGTASSARKVASNRSSGRDRPIRVRLQPRVVEYGPARVSLSGISAGTVSVRLRDANDPAGLAYHWTPYPWSRLRPVRGKWRGVLPAPPLLGVYQLQFRVQDKLLESPHWLLRVLPPGTLRRPAFPTPQAVIREYVSDLPGRQVLVAARPWPLARFDHRDPRLHRLFAIAYAPRGDDKPDARLGMFITTVRNGYHGRWRLLEAGTGPYD